MDWNKLQKAVEAINAYYAFGIMVYVAALYVFSHSQLFSWIVIGATPFIAFWTGYLLHGFLQRRRQRYGFTVLSDEMTYEIQDQRTSVLLYSTKLKADADHLIAYPVGYQWTGTGKQGVPSLANPGQNILGVVDHDESGEIHVKPYEEVVPHEGKWHYWLVGLTPPAYKGDIVDVKYRQKFVDTKRTAKPALYYFVRTTTKRLELNVKFPENALPASVTCGYIKPSDPRRSYSGTGVEYDPEKQWATWVIERPKRGYCYRIQWQY